MSKDIIEITQRESAGLVAVEVHRFSLVEIRERVNLVQEVMRGIMKRDTHYGTIPGTPKPTLYKPGAEVLCVTFRIAQEYQITDLSDATTARFRVTCTGRHQVTGTVLGEGVGECSSGEEKYKWRKAVCTEEFAQTNESMRRIKFSSYKGDVKKAPQVRTEAADLSNTVLKMACKRAMIAMTLNVTAASDIFTQDIEDIPEELRGNATDNFSPKTESSTELPECTAAIFAEKKNGWMQMVQSGKKTAEDLLKMLSTRATFNAEQRQEIQSWSAKTAQHAATNNDDFTKALDASGDYTPE